MSNLIRLPKAYHDVLTTVNIRKACSDITKRTFTTSLLDRLFYESCIMMSGS
jgi:hypothetical protein